MSHALDESLEFQPRWGADGLLTAVAVDAQSGAVLMVAHMNPDALAATLATGEAHYWSRSRRELWHKGATSGAIQRVVEIRVDCDQDCLLLLVEPAGPACHTGRGNCFYRRLDAGRLVML
ncbi:phosphoribosyl-AMP cyclohydrolase [Sphingomonas sp. IBVSS1]|nr:phosphoribosyl-AMP cyclohydrolase [Sphingomonas sp. IBVSS1]